MKISSSGTYSRFAQTIHPSPGYTSPNLWPDALIECTRGTRKSHSRSASRKGAMNPPDAASTWIGMSRPVRASRSSSAAASSCTGSYTPLYVTPRIGTTPIVFSSTAASMPSVVRYGLAFVIGT